MIFRECLNILWKQGAPVSEWTELYNRLSSSYNLAIIRDDRRMEDHLKGEYYRDRKFGYLLREGGRPVAHLIFQDIRHDPAAILAVLAWRSFSRIAPERA